MQNIKKMLLVNKINLFFYCFRKDILKWKWLFSLPVSGSEEYSEEYCLDCVKAPLPAYLPSTSFVLSVKMATQRKRQMMLKDIKGHPRGYGPYHIIPLPVEAELLRFCFLASNLPGLVQQHGQLRPVYSKVPIDVHNFHPDEISKPGANRNHHETFSSVSCAQYPRSSGLPAAQGHTRGALVVRCSFKEQVWREQACHHHCCAHCMEIQL